MTLIVGLTGGIASGKSTVSDMLARRGARVLDADRLAREVVAPGTQGIEEIARAFGPDVIRPDGALDREALGRLVFGDAEARRRLEAITHPRIAAHFLGETERARGEGVDVLVYDAALLVESGAHRLVDRVVVVTASPEERIRRVLARDGLSREEVEARLRAQAPAEEKLAVADHVIENNGSEEELRAQVDALWEELKP